MERQTAKRGSSPKAEAPPEGVADLLDALPGPAWFLDADGDLAAANPAFHTCFSVEPEALGQPLPVPFRQIGCRMENASQTVRLPLRCGSVRPFLVLPLPSAAIKMASYRGWMAVEMPPDWQEARSDPTGEIRLQRLNRLHALLSRTNEIILRARAPKELYREACRFAVEAGGLRLAWIAEWSETGFKVVAQFGEDRGYIRQVATHLNEASEGDGPVRRLLASGLYHYTNQIARDPGFVHRQEALARGLHACASFPLMLGGRVYAVLTVYADEPGFFQDEELSVLSALADDLSFAMEAIRREEERQRAEAQFKAGERRMATLLANLPGIAYRCRLDADWTMEFLSDGCREITGYDPTDLLHNRLLSYVELIVPEDRKRVADLVERAVRAGQSYELTYRITRADGSLRWCWERGVAVLDPASGGDLRLEGFITDITAQREAQTRIRRQAELLNKASDAITVSNSAGRIEYWNRGAEMVYGWMTHETIGKPLSSLLALPPETEREATRTLAETGGWTGELLPQRKDGTPVMVRSRWTLIVGDAGEPDRILRIDTDISERRQLEEQMLRAQRLESIGSLAGGVAHDLNNVLAPILVSLDLLRPALTQSEHVALLDTVRTSAVRGGLMIRQILSFARGLESERAEIDPADLLADLRLLIRETLPRSIALEVEATDSLPLLHANPTQLNQVLLNLCVNARDAMPHGGLLRVSAFAHPRVGASREGGQPDVVLEVADTGSGMEPEVIQKIFEPFFTTKAHGHGTGLGLSTTRSIIHRHGGSLEVESVPGRGSTFRVVLPGFPHPTQSVPSPPPPLTPIQEGTGEMIFLIEDEASIRSIVEQVLQTFGYRVCTADNGRDAVAFFAEHHAEVDLVLSDMMMPLLDGPGLVQALREIDPAVRIVGVSGLPVEDIFADADLDASVLHGFLSKPFSADDLLRVLTTVLSRPEPG